MPSVDPLIPAKAGIKFESTDHTDHADLRSVWSVDEKKAWVPAFAGMSGNLINSFSDLAAGPT